MAREIGIFAPAAVTNRVPFVVSVEVCDVTPGRRITVMLEHKYGEGPARPVREPAVVTVNGDAAFVSFQVLLHERGMVLLLATAHDDAGVVFHPDGAVVEVV